MSVGASPSSIITIPRNHFAAGYQDAPYMGCSFPGWTSCYSWTSPALSADVGLHRFRLAGCSLGPPCYSSSSQFRNWDSGCAAGLAAMAKTELSTSCKESDTHSGTGPMPRPVGRLSQRPQLFAEVSFCHTPIKKTPSDHTSTSLQVDDLFSVAGVWAKKSI